jgi:2-phospho-L-lactate guanylyltransferase
MDLWAILPVKSLSESKGRLAHLLSPDSRAQLVRNLLNHVLVTIQEVPRISQVLVISRDPEVWQIAEAFGALAVEEVKPYGLNSAVAHAYGLAANGGAGAVLILPADLPFVTAVDIDAMIDAGLNDWRGNGTGLATAMGFESSLALAVDTTQPVMAICSDRRGDGTNGLLLRPAMAFNFFYGPNSLKLHIQEAVERGCLVRLVEAVGLQFDLDVEQDWQIFQEDERSKPIAGFMLRSLDN